MVLSHIIYSIGWPGRIYLLIMWIHSTFLVFVFLFILMVFISERFAEVLGLRRMVLTTCSECTCDSNLFNWISLELQNYSKYQSSNHCTGCRSLAALASNNSQLWNYSAFLRLIPFLHIFNFYKFEKFTRNSSSLPRPTLMLPALNHLQERHLPYVSCKFGQIKVILFNAYNSVS